MSTDPAHNRIEHPAGRCRWCEHHLYPTRDPDRYADPSGETLCPPWTWTLRPAGSGYAHVIHTPHTGGHT